VHNRARAILLGGLALGVLFRLIQIATSVGSVDAFFWTRHVQLVEQFGVVGSYFAAEVVNHPPLALLIAQGIARVGGWLGLRFFDSFRLLQLLADIVTTFALFRIAHRTANGSAGYVALAFFLSPAVIFVSAFHCNSDPLMMMLIVLSILAVLEERPVLGGIAIGAAVGIKIIAFVALPLLFLACRGKKARLQFLGSSALVGAIVFLPAIALGGTRVIRNIFGYTGWKGGWGLPLLAHLANRAFPGLTKGDPAWFATPLLVLAMLSLWATELWRSWRGPEMEPSRLTRIIGFAYLLVIFLAPGFLPYYFFWFLPFLAFVFSRPWTLVFHGLTSIFLFWIYTEWSGGWPWTYANGTNSTQLGVFGLFVWLAIGIALVPLARSLYWGAKSEAGG
jgi:hypothetical protein